MKKSMYEVVMKGDWENVLKKELARKSKMASKSNDDFYFSADLARQKLRLGPNDMLEVLNTTDSTDRVRTNRDADFPECFFFPFSVVWCTRRHLWPSPVSV